MQTQLSCFSLLPVKIGTSKKLHLVLPTKIHDGHQERPLSPIDYIGGHHFTGQDSVACCAFLSSIFNGIWDKGSMRNLQH